MMQSFADFYLGSKGNAKDGVRGMDGDLHEVISYIESILFVLFCNIVLKTLTLS